MELITAFFPGFRDSFVYKGQQVFFYKRAQILAGDLWGSGCAEFKDVASLTMFPDYRVPQILHTWEVLTYSAELSRIVSEKTTLEPGSEMEVEIRAASVVACDKIASTLGVIPIHVDWLLWQRAESRLSELKNHHRTLTIFY